MNIEIKPLRKKDHKKAIQYAITGMHFNFYLDNKFALNLYGRYFWYLEITNATQIIAAYQGDELVGVLLAEMKNEEKAYHSFWRSLYVKLFNWIQEHILKDSAGIYELTNQAMLAHYKLDNTPDGELRFLASAPNCQTKGIGTLLLQELERLEPKKEIFLFTDDQCTYQFYEHRGFDKMGEKDIVLNINKKDIPLRCLLYRKIIQ